MNWQHIGLNLILAVILFFLNGKLGKLQGNHEGIFDYGKFTFDSNTETNFSGNFFLKTINPAIFLLLICAMLQKINLATFIPSTWMLVPFFWGLRFIFFIFKNLISFINWKYELSSLCISLFLSEGALQFFILPLASADEPIFISATEFRGAFWFAVIAYLAKVLWDIFKSKFDGESVFPDQKRRDILSARYHRFVSKYDVDVDVYINKNCTFPNTNHRAQFKCLVYAIMIYEDYCRPAFMRVFEYIGKALDVKEKPSLGIMQVQTDQLISNRQSIDLAIKKLFSAFKGQNSPADGVQDAILDYNHSCSYYDEVIAIFYYLLDLNGIEQDSDEEQTADSEDVVEEIFD